VKVAGTEEKAPAADGGRYKGKRGQLKLADAGLVVRCTLSVGTGS
jgi:hypothetical protein